jgi:DNA repair protein RadC
VVIELKTELAVREVAEDGLSINAPETAFHSVESLQHAAQEMFCVLTLNGKNRLIRRHLVSLGTANSTLVHPREVFRPAIQDGAVSIIVAHNHPSGDPSPSANDIRITKNLIEAGKIIQIGVIDHLIVGNTTLSLRETGLVTFNPEGGCQ